MILYERKAKETNKEYAYRVLKTNIMHLTLKPGEALSEAELGELLGLSRTPIREIIMQLKQEYLIEVIPQTGTYVSLIDLGLVREASFTRYIMEKEIIKLACEEFSGECLDKLERNIFAQRLIKERTEDKVQMHLLDIEFHEIIFNGVGMSHLWESISKLSSHYNRMRLLYEIKNTNINIVEDHERILNSIKNKNIDEVKDIVTKHIIDPTYNWYYLFNEDSEYSSYFKK